jgi:hypothetical protein
MPFDEIRPSWVLKRLDPVDHSCIVPGAVNRSAGCVGVDVRTHPNCAHTAPVLRGLFGVMKQQTLP